MEFCHVVTEKLTDRLVGDFTIVGDESWRELEASMEFISRELQNARMLRGCCWPTAVPIFPGDVPITPEGFRVNEF